MTLTQAIERADYLAKRTGEDYQVLEDSSCEGKPLSEAYYLLTAGQQPAGGFTPDEVVYHTGWTL